MLRGYTICLVFGLLVIGGYGSNRDILDDLHQLIQQYQIVWNEAISTIRVNMQGVIERIYGMGTVMKNELTMSLSLIESDLILGFAGLEERGKEADVDVTVCTREPTERVNTLANYLRLIIVQCVDYRMVQGDRIVRQMFINTNNTIVPTSFYLDRVDECEIAANMEECIVQVLVQVSSSIEYLPVIVREDIDDIKDFVDELVESYRDCSGSETVQLSLQGNMILAETKQCVDDILRDISAP